MDAAEIQRELFGSIKAGLSPDLSAADEIACILDVSVDGAYRRIRGEKIISFDELQKLCVHYKISVDRLLNVRENGFLFQGDLLDEDSFDYEAYIDSRLASMTNFNKFQQKEIYGLYKDIPPFHHYHFRELAGFKDFYYQKNILHSSKFKNQKFSCDDCSTDVFEKGQRFLHLYNQMKSVEIWSFETINSIIRQIEYYRDNQVFKSDYDPYMLYEAIERLLDHLEAQAAIGRKFEYNDSTRTLLGEYNLYFNEMMVGSNELLFILDGKRIAVVIHSVINYMTTRDLAFTENIYKSMDNLMKRSTLISVVSEKERSRFFRILRERVARKKSALAA